jgi:hypothetical protein
MFLVSDRLTYNVCVYDDLGLGGFVNDFKNVKADRSTLSAYTKLNKETESCEDTKCPSWHKHSVGSRLIAPACCYCDKFPAVPISLIQLQNIMSFVWSVAFVITIVFCNYQMSLVGRYYGCCVIDSRLM